MSDLVFFCGGVITMSEWVLYVMTWASRLSGYPFPDALPQVQFQSESWFSHRACKDHIPCPVYGLYEDHDVVYLREDLTDSAKDHVAAHEFVHYLQQHSGRFDLSSCLDTDKREQEAFRVQSRFVSEVQGGFEYFQMAHLPCRPVPATAPAAEAAPEAAPESSAEPVAAP